MWVQVRKTDLQISDEDQTAYKDEIVVQVLN